MKANTKHYDALDVMSEMDILKKQYNKGDISLHQYRLLKEHLDNVLFSITGDTELYF